MVSNHFGRRMVHMQDTLLTCHIKKNMIQLRQLHSYYLVNKEPNPINGLTLHSLVQVTRPTIHVKTE